MTKLHPHHVYRASFSFPAPLAVDIAYVAKRIGVSQSALLVELLSEPITLMADLMRGLPEHEMPTPDQVLRARGASLELLRERIQDAQRMLDQETGT